MATQFITLAEAIQMTTKYRENREAILDPRYRDQNILPICESFDRDVFDKVLAQEGCAGLRTYLGMDDSLLVKVIVVGVDANGRDMLPATSNNNAARAASTSTTDPGSGNEGLIIENGIRCPTNCPPSSDLN